MFSFLSVGLLSGAISSWCHVKASLLLFLQIIECCIPSCMHVNMPICLPQYELLITLVKKKTYKA